MGMEDRKILAGSQIAQILEDHGFDEFEATEILADMLSGIISETALSRDNADYIYDVCAGAARIAYDGLVEAKRNING